MADWRFAGEVRRVVDGDTVDVTLDLGFGISRAERVRLAGIDAPEMRGDERDLGREAKAWLLDEIPPGSPIVCVTVRERGKYGRYVARLYRPGESESINAQIVDAGHAVRRDY